MKHPRIIVIQGPTASGKTKLGVELAKAFDSVIISADSRQFYKEISIGTAKPTKEEQEGITHYFINSHNLVDEVSASRFAREARDLIYKELLHLKAIIVVGGSGLFIQALCEGLDDIPHDHSLQKELTDIYQNQGIQILLDELLQKDPEYFNLIDVQNPLRVIRAIEAIRLSGQSMTSLRKGLGSRIFQQIEYFTLSPKREELYYRINKRVDEMILGGLEVEAKSVYNLKDLKSLQTVGYKELFDYFEGKITRDNAVELIKQHSRNYAKRQITWFKSHHPGIYLTENLKTNLETVLSSIS